MCKAELDSDMLPHGIRGSGATVLLYCGRSAALLQGSVLHGAPSFVVLDLHADMAAAAAGCSVRLQLCLQCMCDAGGTVAF